MSREPLKTPERHRGKFSWRVITAESKGSTIFYGVGRDAVKISVFPLQKEAGSGEKGREEAGFGKGRS